MYPASSHPGNRRSARQSAARRPLLEALECRSLLSATLAWAKVFGLGQPVFSDAIGNAYLTNTSGQLAKFYPDGSIDWIVPATGSVTAANTDAIYTTYAKYSAGDGSLLWSLPPMKITDIAPTPDGGAEVLGYFQGTIDADPGPGVHHITSQPYQIDDYLLKLDSTGQFVWAQDVPIADTADPETSRLGIDAAGNAILALTDRGGTRPPFTPGGVRIEQFDPAGSFLQAFTVGDTGTQFSSIAVSPTGDFVISGDTNTTAPPDFDPGPAVVSPQSDANPYQGAYLARYDSAGSLAWVRAIQPNSAVHSSQSAPDVDLASNGDIAVVANVSDGVSSFGLVQRYDSAGNLIDQSPFNATLNSVSFGRNGVDIFVSGTFTNTVDFDPSDSTYNLTDPNGSAPTGFILRLDDSSDLLPNELGGTPIGTPGSWNNSGNDLTKALDNNASTYFDAPTPQAWVGLDLGTPENVSSVLFLPRQGLEWRMLNGTFQGSNNLSNWTTLATITSTPISGHASSLTLDSSTPFRYVRYLSPDNGYGNIAELHFFGAQPNAGPPASPIHPVASFDGSHVVLNWTDIATNETGYEAQLVANPDVVADRPANFNQLDFDSFNTPGTYYVRLRAVNDNAPGNWISAGTVTIPGSPALPAVPTNLAYTRPADDALMFTWTGNATNETGYTAELSTSPTFSSGVITRSLQANNDVVRFLDIDPNIDYYFRVAATNSAGASDYATITATSETTPAPLTGTPIGTPGSWNNSGNDLTKALDKNPDTYFDAPTSQAWVGLDLGSPKTISSVRFRPRKTLEWRMLNGTFQGSNGLSNWTTLATITTTPPADGSYVTLNISNSTPFRYVRYLSPVGGYGNISELEFQGRDASPIPPSSPLTGTPIGTPGSWNNSGNDLSKAFDNNPATFFDAPTSQAAVGYDLGSPFTITSISYTPRAGLEFRMVGGQFLGSNDGVNWTLLSTITQTPSANTANTINLVNPAVYRYVECLSPVGGYGNIAELNFFGYAPQPESEAPGLRAIAPARLPFAQSPTSLRSFPPDWPARISTAAPGFPGLASAWE